MKHDIHETAYDGAENRAHSLKICNHSHRKRNLMMDLKRKTAFIKSFRPIKIKIRFSICTANNRTRLTECLFIGKTNFYF